jgi:hypothetical protein
MVQFVVNFEEKTSAALWFFNSQKRLCPTLGCKLKGDFLKPQVEPTATLDQHNKL